MKFTWKLEYSATDSTDRQRASMCAFVLVTSVCRVVLLLAELAHILLIWMKFCSVSDVLPPRPACDIAKIHKLLKSCGSFSPVHAEPPQ